MAKTISFTKEEDIKVLSDPYRIRILDTYKTLARPATVKQVADKLGDSSAKVTFHVKKLIALGLLTLDHTEQINGITAKFYKLEYESISIARSDENSTVKFNPVGDAILRMMQQDLKALSQTQADTSVFTHQTLYLSEEDFKSLSQEIVSLNQKYSAPKEGLKTYNYYMALLQSPRD